MILASGFRHFGQRMVLLYHVSFSLVKTDSEKIFSHVNRL